MYQYSTNSTHLMGRDPGRPLKTRGPCHGKYGCSNSSTHLLCRGLGRPAKNGGVPHGYGGEAK